MHVCDRQNRAGEWPPHSIVGLAWAESDHPSACHLRASVVADAAEKHVNAKWVQLAAFAELAVASSGSPESPGKSFAHASVMIRARVVDCESGTRPAEIDLCSTTTAKSIQCIMHTRSQSLSP